MAAQLARAPFHFHLCLIIRRLLQAQTEQRSSGFFSGRRILQHSLLNADHLGRVAQFLTEM